MIKALVALRSEIGHLRMNEARMPRRWRLRRQPLLDRMEVLNVVYKTIEKDLRDLSLHLKTYDDTTVANPRVAEGRK